MVYDLEAATLRLLKTSEAEREQFGARFLKQVLFGELTMPVKKDTIEKRVAKRHGEIAFRQVGGNTRDFDACYDNLAEDGNN